MTEAQVPRIVRARRIITMTDEQPEALVMLGERIVATGAAADLAGRFPGAERIDVGPAVVVPGLNDAHAHPCLCADGGLYVDLGPDKVTDAGQVRDALAARAAQTPPGEWVVGHNFDVSRTGDGATVDRDLLDQVSTEHPVLIIHYSYHGAVANSAALAAAGYDASTPDPTGGELVRDAAGQPTGVLYERAWTQGYLGHGNRPGLLPSASIEARVASLARMLGRMNAAGLTSVCDALVHPAHWELYQAARGAGALTARIGMLLWYEFFDPAVQLGLSSGFGDPWLRFTGVKMMADGAVSGGTCLCSRPYQGTHGETTGIQVMTDDELRDAIHLVHRAGSRLAVHANGDLAITKVLDALEAAQAETPARPGQVHRIEHCSDVDDHLIERIRGLGVIPVPFGAFVHYHGHNLVAHYGTERARRLLPHRRLRDAGVTVAGSSDYPCGPLEPLLALRSMTTRRTHDGTVLGADQRLTPLEALEVYTVGSAAASGEDGIKGRLAPGFLADFTVLDDDPLAVPLDELSAIPVRATWVGGREVWAASTT
ncbi:amidohydrolase [Phytoactinopolyspora limicola]|uniref:amidohydrolase n=1 Tax=Phytoactinopolyspora limicola TaxID=2715536 RepID=UPI00140B2E8F|nr:amidohydrolase [Phytoactinopolyspora limicola]